MCATSTSISDVPSENLGTVYVGDFLSLSFKVVFNESSCSSVAFSILFNSSAWSYNGFDAYMNGIDVSDQFEFEISTVSVFFCAKSLSPANGTLIFTVFFVSKGLNGTYTFSWDCTAVAMPPPGPYTPVLDMRNGVSHVLVEQKAEKPSETPFPEEKRPETKRVNMIIEALKYGVIACLVITVVALVIMKWKKP